MSVVYLSHFRIVTNSGFKVSDAIMKHNSTRGANTMEFPIGKFAVGANTMVKTIDSRVVYHLHGKLIQFEIVLMVSKISDRKSHSDYALSV
jgi:hypothetical protein